MSMKSLGALALLALLLFTILTSQRHSTTWARPAAKTAAVATAEIEVEQKLIGRRDSGESESNENGGDEDEFSYGLTDESKQIDEEQQQQERTKQETRRNAFNLLNPAQTGVAQQRRRHWARDQHKRDEQHHGRRGEAGNGEEGKRAKVQILEKFLVDKSKKQ